MIKTNPSELTKLDERWQQIGQLAQEPQQVTEEELEDMEHWAYRVAEAKEQMGEEGREDEFADFLHKEMQKGLGGKDV